LRHIVDHSSSFLQYKGLGWAGWALQLRFLYSYMGAIRYVRH
jgi:hypothetical protein